MSSNTVTCECGCSSIEEFHESSFEVYQAPASYPEETKGK